VKSSVSLRRCNRADSHLQSQVLPIRH
jgi:hypothetical protein